MVATAVSNEEALGILQHDVFDIVLSELSALRIDGYQLLKEIQRNPNLESTFVMFLSIKSDVWNRVKSLKLGAKDFIVKPVHVNEIVARVSMVQKRVELFSEKQVTNSNKFSGRLEDLSVIDLIEVFGAEKKTGVLSINNENSHSGQIIFNRGHVINASAESLRAEEAVYKMIYWNRGRFTMLFTEVHVEDEFTISNMGLLLQGAKRMDIRNELLKQLPSLDAIVITTSNFKKIISQKNMNIELKEFLTLFDGERSLGRIIDDSHENEIVTLKRIVKLYKLGFLHVLRDFSSEQPIQFKSADDDDFAEFVPFEEKDELFEEADPDNIPYDPDHEIDKVVPDNFPGNNNYKVADDTSVGSQIGNMRENEKEEISEQSLFKTEPTDNSTESFDSKSHVVIIGVDDQKNKLFVDSLISNDMEEILLPSTSMPIYRGGVNFRGGNQLNVAGIKPDENFTMILDYFSVKTLGCILLIDLDNVNWGYHRYLVKALDRQLNAKKVIVCKQSQANSDFESHEVRRNLGLDESITLRFIDEVDSNNCRRILFTLLHKVDENHQYLMENESERIAAK